MNIAAHVYWEARKGDLVKIKSFRHDGDVEYSNGIILERIEKEQQTMFPAAKVYLFKSGNIVTVSPAAIEIISANS
tara:strand:+ start:877 stop:1104 length:228 start_codon:yes stop_codon:yes gene_type:complete